MVTMAAKATTAHSTGALGRTLHEVALNESIRYAPDDVVEQWLNKLLCLDVTVVPRTSAGCPLPDNCELYPLISPTIVEEAQHLSCLGVFIIQF